MPLIQVDTMFAAGPVRVRAKAADPHEGLRGHAYIQARALNQPVSRIPGPDMEAEVMNILAHAKKCTRLHVIVASPRVKREAK
ncbi:hypothetical protein [Herbaspirillum sp. ST 5-3]|uniref:hypothetical protein n=1 Tax=Oxalobacteraceae TaxID=75682 RepID=UPI0010A59615|nr:hypothetical protein [Herbaspirillum sp. ST 5-3]